ncbi:MAG: protein-methionine-sulfoxide reductase catalytic subunit MsrP [Paracoccaceae bacterium]
MKRLNRPSWAISENRVTPEAVFWNRRRVLAAVGGVGLAGGVGALALTGSEREAVAAAEETARTSGLPAPGTPFAPRPGTNPAFADAGRAVTPFETASTYNNFYEFGSHKKIHEAARALDTDGWSVRIDGLVDRPQTIAVEDLLASMPMEERIVRHRCVEAWSMVVPWIGFPLSALIERAGAGAGARYVRFETFMNEDVARGQRQHWYPWPYTEGLTLAEATHPLAFMVVGAYGKILPEQFGAPMRLHVPWKYGFKSIKSIVRVSLVEERPESFWEALAPSEYGFWANVNPEVPHPRWSQAEERVLGTDEEVATERFNGYEAEVAGLYTEAQIAGTGRAFWR